MAALSFVEFSLSIRTTTSTVQKQFVQRFAHHPGPWYNTALQRTALALLTGFIQAANRWPAALAPLIQQNALAAHDGFLVACYSAHPLVESLRENTSRPVVGIFQASIFWALSLGGRFGIITTTRRWGSYSHRIRPRFDRFITKICKDCVD